MRSIIKNYLGMIAIAVVAVLIFGAIGVRIDRDQELQPPTGIEATPAITGNAPIGLVDAQWLQQYRTQVDYIFDLSDPRQFEAGHIPGAIHIWWQDAMAINSENYAELDQISNPENPEAIFDHLALDVPQNSRIILYDNHNSERATWLLWVMRINGYTDVHVLDGGLPAWIGTEGELSTEVDDSRDETIVATPTWNSEHLIRREQLRESVENGNMQIVDTRSAEEQLDTVNGTVREGHIPGSINIPTAEVMREDGTFRSPEELQELFASYGLSPENDIVVYSLFSSQSGNLWMAFQIAGFDNAVIYMEGFVGWGRDHNLPVSTDPYPSADMHTAIPGDESTPANPEDSTTPPASTPDEEGPTDLTGI